ncbi:hypothetical protein PINS_up011934 [Pythium insidiosum]|nr:hypothetical protein PINS_up011934 [Pythium insidiosum]
MIRAEMTTFAPSTSYLDFLPDYEPTFEGHPRLLSEYRRVKANVPLNAIDMNRYHVKEPTGANAESVEAWEGAVRKLQVSVQQQSDRVTNLELQQAYGAKLWKVRASVLDGVSAQCEKALEGAKAASEAVNVKRKQEQLLNAPKLQSYQRKLLDLVEKNDAIQRATEIQEQRLKKQRLDSNDGKTQQ